MNVLLGKVFLYKDKDPGSATILFVMDRKDYNNWGKKMQSGNNQMDQILAGMEE